MKKKYTDTQSYFQDWVQIKKKEVQNMEESMWNTYERVFVVDYQQYKKISVQK